MHKLNSYKDLRVGKVYNRIYTGDNEAHARINGKQTFVVIRRRPHLVVQTLHPKFGNPFAQQLRRGETMLTHPHVAFAECDLFEPSGPQGWFVKSQIMTLEQALSLHLVMPNELNGLEKRARRHGLNQAYYCYFDVEGRSQTNPYLQRIFVVWSDKQALLTELDRLRSR